ncbi:hypothetical protein [Streptomyces sp. IMTB 2501]|uniref:hypothetical protein n=1 Tax=Streptomyces sp. IMTB 2501 TaxID=1776340 RepID=UPI0015B90D98|nr:hypothetical protein [Streptomyces sp. IMTB 2501]
MFTAAVTIPTLFHGGLPATAKATYAAGANAGPADWTPCQPSGTRSPIELVRQGNSSPCRTAAFTGSGRTLPGPTRSRPNPARRRGSRRPRRCARRWRG